MEVRGIAEVGMGDLVRAVGATGRKSFKGEFVRKAWCCREFQEVRSESRFEPRRKPGRPLARGQPGCRHKERPSSGAPLTAQAAHSERFCVMKMVKQVQALRCCCFRFSIE